MQRFTDELLISYQKLCTYYWARLRGHRVHQSAWQRSKNSDRVHAHQYTILVEVTEPICSRPTRLLNFYGCGSPPFFSLPSLPPARSLPSFLFLPPFSHPFFYSHPSPAAAKGFGAPPAGPGAVRSPNDIWCIFFRPFYNNHYNRPLSTVRQEMHRFSTTLSKLSISKSLLLRTRQAQRIWNKMMSPSSISLERRFYNTLRSAAYT